MSRALPHVGALLLGLVLMAGCSSPQAELEWHQERGYRWAEVSTGWFDRVGFELLDASRTGISFENRVGEEDIARNRNYLNGSGVAAGDVDGDGWVDLYLARLDGPNKLYRNRGGFAFEDVTDEAGVAHDGYYSTGVALSDVDGDGDLDLLVASMSRENVLYLNDGTGRFERKDDSGLGASRGSTTLALADVDGDGYPDLYVANFKEKTVKDLYGPTERTLEKTVAREAGAEETRLVLRPPFDEHYEILYPEHRPPDRREVGATDAFYFNNGDGTFRKATDLEHVFRDENGEPLGLARDWGLTATFQDLNGDQQPDLYVCNDFWTPDRVWVNQGDGTFRALGSRAFRNHSFASMAVDFSDIDRDGVLDAFVTEMLSARHERRVRQQVSYDPYDQSIGDLAYRPQYMRNSLYLGRPDHTFAEITYYSGTEATEWSWATRFLDVDLDGYEDLIVNTGYSYDVQDLDAQERITRQVKQRGAVAGTSIFEYPPLHLPNKALRNNGDLTFTETSEAWGFTADDVSHGLATADFDRDGDLDLAVNRLNETAAIYRNTTARPRIGVRLLGRSPNTQAIGAEVRLDGGPVVQDKQVVEGGAYLSDSDPYIVFAARPDQEHHRLVVTWPDGAATAIDSVRANRIYEIEQPDAGPSLAAASPAGGETMRPEPIFHDVSGRIDHRHHEPYYNDFGVQPLLPLKLSQLGPGASWIDFDRDGDDDLFVASGKGGALGLWANDGDGRFERRTVEPLTDEAPGDQTTVLGWGGEDGTHLVIGSSNFEQGRARAPAAYHYLLSPEGGVQTQRLPGIRSATGALAAADYDGDGRLDLFVGGRFKPAQYPTDARSRLFRNANGTFELDRANAEVLNDLGLVTGAVFTDYDQDGDPDLLVSRAWDALVLLENRDGTFYDVSARVGLDAYNGWWNGVATGDFTGDGRPDVVATNRGPNSVYQLRDDRPLKLFYGDFNLDRRPEMIEAYYRPATESYVPLRMMYSLYGAIPALRDKVKTHEAYGRTSVGQLVGREIDRVPSKEITTLQHTLFLNTGEGFTAHPLPAEAQFATAFAAGVADLDNDGNEDLFLSQNLFALPKLTPRQDAGRGLWLRGDGHGHLTPLDGIASGVTVYGEQRGAALSDFDRDGRVDLVVSQNGAATKLYRNQSPKRGLRVELRGPAYNEEAIGSSLRVVYSDGRKGPRREVQAGSGYWSQNSAVQVLGTAAEPARIEVTWFDGARETVRMADEWHIVIEHPSRRDGA